MSFSLKTISRITRLRSFADCVEYFSYAPKVPVPKKFAHEYANQRTLTPDSKSSNYRLYKFDDRFECVLYRTPMVTYYADGNVAIESDHRIASSAFTDHVVPAGISVCDGMRTVIVSTPKGKETYAFVSRVIEFASAGTPGQWAPIGGVGLRKGWRTDRVKAREVMKKLKPTLDLVKATRRITSGEWSKWAPDTSLLSELTAPEPDILFLLEHLPIPFTPKFRNFLMKELGARTTVEFAPSDPSIPWNRRALGLEVSL